MHVIARLSEPLTHSPLQTVDCGWLGCVRVGSLIGTNTPHGCEMSVVGEEVCAHPLCFPLDFAVNLKLPETKKPKVP